MTDSPERSDRETVVDLDPSTQRWAEVSLIVLARWQMDIGCSCFVRRHEPIRVEAIRTRNDTWLRRAGSQDHFRRALDFGYIWLNAGD